MPYTDKTKMYANQIQRWTKRKQAAIEYKGGACEACGYDRYYGALTFHHIDPSTKRWDWSRLRLRTWSDVTSELDVCRLLCMNCHMEEHGKGRY